MPIEFLGSGAAHDGSENQEPEAGSSARERGAVDLGLVRAVAVGVVLVAAAAVSLALPSSGTGHLATAVLIALALLLTLAA